MPVLVLNVDSFATKDQNTGALDGGRMHTVMYAEEDPYAGEAVGFRGVQVFKEVVPAEVASQMQAVPGFYELQHRRFPVKGGKPVEKVVGATLIQAASLF